MTCLIQPFKGIKMGMRRVALPFWPQRMENSFVFRRDPMPIGQIRLPTRSRWAGLGVVSPSRPHPADPSLCSFASNLAVARWEQGPQLSTLIHQETTLMALINWLLGFWRFPVPPARESSV